MNKFGWIIFSTVVVLLLGGLVAWARITNPPIDVSGIENNSFIVASDQNGNIADHISGSDAKKILFIEYGDYQCPSCKGAFQGVKTLSDEYADSVTFVFRNFPLTTIHPNARSAAAAAEAAGLQGKFWQMHDLLYTNQDSWSTADITKRTEIFNGFATTLQLNLDTFKQDVGGDRVNRKINFDLALGKAIGVKATPTFFLDGKELDETTAQAIVQGNLVPIKEKLDELIKAQS